MTERKYMASEMKVEADQERLSWQEKTWDPVTFRNLEMIGVTQGWKCLEVGAGYGSITSWLSERIGPNGKVVATDIRPELHRKVSNTVEIRQHNILKDELEKDYYDLVHCRMVLQHLSEPEEALNRMAEAVKPGGWLLVEEIDNATLIRSDSNDPKADFYYRSVSNFQDMIKQNLYNYEFGRRVRMLLDKLGFDAVEGQGNIVLTRGGEPWAKALIATQEVFKKGMRDSKQMPEEELNKVSSQVFDLLADPTFYFNTSPLCCAWGRKLKK